MRRNARPWIWRLKAGRWPAAILLWGIVLLLAGVPLANLVYKAGVQVTATESGRVRVWSPSKLVESVAAVPGAIPRRNVAVRQHRRGGRHGSARDCIATRLELARQQLPLPWERAGVRVHWRWAGLLHHCTMPHDPRTATRASA